MQRTAHPTHVRIARVLPYEIEDLMRSIEAIERSKELLRQTPPSTHLGNRAGAAGGTEAGPAENDPTGP